jgi:DNA primase
MRIHEKAKSFFNGIIGSPPKDLNKGESAYYCPFCNHHKRKLQVRFDLDSDKFGYYKCWVCEESGKSLFTLLKKLNGSEDQMDKLADLLGQRVRRRGKEEDEEKKSLELPEEYQPLWNPKVSGLTYKHAMRALKKRGLSAYDVVKHRLGYCSSGDYMNRIIIPSYSRDGSLNYFVGRAIWDSEYLSYKNPPAPKSEIVGFEDLISFGLPITLVEGPFDAMAVKRNAIPLFGKTMSDRLLGKIISGGTQRVNVCLDPDAASDALKIAEKLVKEGISVHLVDLPEGKDPDDLGFDRVWKLIRSSKPLTFEQIIHRKLWS